jgi:hypothetical protein
MEPIDPRVSPQLIPLDSRPQVIEHGHVNNQPLPAIVTPRGLVITRWTLTDFERERIAAGEDVFLTIYAAGLLNPIGVSVGPMDWNDETREPVDPWKPGPPK